MADTDSYSYSPNPRLIVRRGHTGLFSPLPYYRCRPSPSVASGRLAGTLLQKMIWKMIRKAHHL